MNVAELLRETVAQWNNDQAPRLAAALAYYATFALAPLLVVLIEVAALVFGGRGHNQVVRESLLSAMQPTIGKPSTNALRDLIQAAFPHAHTHGIIACILSWFILVFGAAGLFGALQSALDTIWQVPQVRRPWHFAVIDRLTSFSIVAGIVFVLLISLAVNTAIASVTKFIAVAIPGFAFVASLLDFAISLVVVTALFAVMFKLLPHTRIAWKHVIPGACVTALLFFAGQLILSWYLGRASTVSEFGAAGSVVVLLVWVYYSGQIFLFGAEFTKVYARRHVAVRRQVSVLRTGKSQRRLVTVRS